MLPLLYFQFWIQEIFLPECADAKEDPPEKATAIATFQWGSEVAPLLHPRYDRQISGDFVRCRFCLCIIAHQNAHGCLSEHSCTRAPWQGKSDLAIKLLAKVSFLNRCKSIINPGMYFVEGMQRVHATRPCCQGKEDKSQLQHWNYEISVEHLGVSNVVDRFSTSSSSMPLWL